MSSRQVTIFKGLSTLYRVNCIEVSPYGWTKSTASVINENMMHDIQPDIRDKTNGISRTYICVDNVIILTLTKQQPLKYKLGFVPMYSHSPCMNTWRRRCLIAKSTRITPNLVPPRQFCDIVDYLSRPGIEHTKLRSPMHHIADLMKKGIHPFDSGDIVIFMQLKHSSIHHYMYVLCVLYMYYTCTIHLLYTCYACT